MSVVPSAPADGGRNKIAFYVPTLAGGGAERVTLTLAAAFAERGDDVDLVLNRKKGRYLDDIPASIRVVELARAPAVSALLALLRAFPADWRLVLRMLVRTHRLPPALRKLPSLARYLASNRPAVMVSSLWYANLVALWARAGAGADTCLIVTLHNTLSRSLAHRFEANSANDCAPAAALIRRVYERADGIVAVSNGVSRDLAATTGLSAGCIQTIYNPVVSPSLYEQAAQPLEHPWFAPGAPPVLLAAGRIEAQKNFPLLIDAFARVRARRPARLMILGEGTRRADLIARIERLALTDDVALPGWVDNPYAYMHRAAVFVLSSSWEGLPTVVIEAMACGCPVVATDCPSGPRELLDQGRYGTLVPVDDADALARAVTDVLEQPPAADALRRRAQDFSVANSVAAYRALISVSRPRARHAARQG